MKITPILWDYRKTKDKRYPIKLRIAQDNRPAKYVPLGVRVEKSQWAGSKVHSSHPEAANINRLILERTREIEADALDGLTTGNRKTGSELADHAKSKGDFYYYFERNIKAARSRGSHHRADVNESMLRMFRLWRPVWLIKDLTVESLSSLEKFLRSKENSSNTIADKMTRIRTVVNEMGILVKNNPFQYYSIRFEDTESNPTPDEDLEKLRSAVIPERHKQAMLARDIWLFCMNAGGMRFGDVCRLKYENIEIGRIRYRMNKTGKMIDVPQTTEAKRILKRYTSEQGKDEDYVFPLLNHRYKTGEAIAKRIKAVNRNLNRSLRYLAKTLKLNQVPKLHGARHTFADKVSDTNAAKDLLGHKSIRTTEIYKKKLRKGTDDHFLAALET